MGWPVTLEQDPQWASCCHAQVDILICPLSPGGPLCPELHGTLLGTLILHVAKNVWALCLFHTALPAASHVQSCCQDAHLPVGSLTLLFGVQRILLPLGQSQCPTMGNMSSFLSRSMVYARATERMFVLLLSVQPLGLCLMPVPGLWQMAESVLQGVRRGPGWGKVLQLTRSNEGMRKYGGRRERGWQEEERRRKEGKRKGRREERGERRERRRRKKEAQDSSWAELHKLMFVSCTQSPSLSAPPSHPGASGCAWG